MLPLPRLLLEPPPPVAWAVVWVVVVVVNKKISVAISNSVVFGLIVVHIPNFIHISQPWLVGTFSKKIAVFISNSFYLVFRPIFIPEPILIIIG